MLIQAALSFFWLSSILCVEFVEYDDSKLPQFELLPSISELAKKDGHTSTNYLVTTYGGHKIWIHRIGNNTGPPVLLQHGYLMAADCWMVRRGENSLVNILLSRGYDVWLSNFRGNVYDVGHIKYSRKDYMFWDFSVHEIGTYDLPSFIDTILTIRKVPKLFYIGHSLGTTVFMIMASQCPSYNDKVRAAILLSPVAYGPLPMTHGLQVWCSFYQVLSEVQSQIKAHEVTPRTDLLLQFLYDQCGKDATSFDKAICLSIQSLMTGEHRSNLNCEEWNLFVLYTISGTSIGIVRHLLQILQSDEFMALDTNHNMELYGKTTPPKYNLEIITTPVAMFWGENDAITSKDSLRRVAEALPTVIFSKLVPDPDFNHADFLIGANAKSVLYPDILPVLEKY